jgi:hypothetical protein
MFAFHSGLCQSLTWQCELPNKAIRACYRQRWILTAQLTDSNQHAAIPSSGHLGTFGPHVVVPQILACCHGRWLNRNSAYAAYQKAPLNYCTLVHAQWFPWRYLDNTVSYAEPTFHFDEHLVRCLVLLFHNYALH